jgi:hypothetical protein
LGFPSRLDHERDADRGEDERDPSSLNAVGNKAPSYTPTVVTGWTSNFTVAGSATSVGKWVDFLVTVNFTGARRLWWRAHFVAVHPFGRLSDMGGHRLMHHP